MAYKQIDEENFLDRDTFRRIKKMNRATLERLIDDIYERGRKKGLTEAGVKVDDAASDDGEETLYLRAVESEIRGIKGIGEKRIEEIMLISLETPWYCVIIKFDDDSVWSYLMTI